MSFSETHHLLRASGLRVTPQRRAIVEAFQGGDTEHLSAEEVHSRASTKVPELGRGTVYATLAELSELGLLGAVGTPDPVRYEINVEPHDHFRCRLCLRLFDVALGGPEIKQRPLGGFAIETVAVIAEGICEQCLDYQRGLTEGAETVQQQPLLSHAQLDRLACLEVQGPLGHIALAASDDGIVRVAFPEHADFGDMVAHARADGSVAAVGRLRDLDEALQGYFGGGRDPLTSAVDWELSLELNATALREVAKIPFASHASYERLMGDLSPLECGRTMGANPVPLLIPCHRVSCGSLRPEVYVGGLERLRQLQALEAS